MILEEKHIPDKESIYQLQKLDCNCSDCAFMDRNMQKFQESLVIHEKWQRDYFETIKRKKLERAKFWKTQGDDKKHDHLIKEANEMKFQFDKKEAMINYGHCKKFDKPVSFIPVTCQLHTQECFVHRKDLTINKIISTSKIN